MSYPSSVQKQVLAALKRGESLTTFDAINRWGVTRLASIIHRLRRAGLEVQTVKRRGSNGSIYAEYRLPSTA